MIKIVRSSPSGPGVEFSESVKIIPFTCYMPPTTGLDFTGQAVTFPELVGLQYWGVGVTWGQPANFIDAFTLCDAKVSVEEIGQILIGALALDFGGQDINLLLIVYLKDAE